MGKKSIFFDLDDTLYDRSVPYYRAFEAFFGGRYAEKAEAAFLAVAQRGYEVFVAAHTGKITMDEMYIYRHQTGLRDVGIEISVEEALEMQALYEEAQRHISLTPVMEEILTFCRERFAAVGVITNGGVASQRGKLDSLGAEQWIRPDLVFISDAVGIMKPDPAIFRLAQQAVGARAEDCVYVGDSISQDVTPALRCGWHSIWLNRREAARGEAETETVVSTESELLRCLRGTEGE